jgi:uncharacterized protein YjbI with pentapeptide repeats
MYFSKPIPLEDLFTLYASGERNFAGLEFRNTSSDDRIVEFLKNIKIHNANLRGAILSGVYLKGIDLSGSDLSGADLSRSRLMEANLSEVNLTGSNLTETILYSANLTKTCLESANLTRADLRGAECNFANFSQSVLIETKLSGAKNVTIKPPETFFAFFWKTIMPDGTVEVGPRYSE